jgi:hypothetical protein
MTTTAIRTVPQIVVERFKEADGVKQACEVVENVNFWANHFSTQTGYKPSAEFNAAASTAANAKNLISFASAVPEFHGIAAKVDQYRSIDATVSPEAQVEKQEARKEILQRTVGIVSPLQDGTDLWHAAVKKISEATRDLFAKIGFTALAIFMGWKAKDEIECVRTNYEGSYTAVKTNETEKSDKLWQWVKLGVVNTAKYVSYFVLAALKLFSHFGGYVIAPWAYVTCVSAGLILGIGGHFYSKMNALEKNPAILVHHHAAVEAVTKAAAVKV